jgi:indole-3-glycerol phosphate synthase
VTASLTTILDATRARVSGLRARAAELKRSARDAPRAPSWIAAFVGEHLTVIAEIKRRSPSAGGIAPNLDAAAYAERYVAGGARAVSVLTEEAHFGGSLADLVAVRRAVPAPVLRKDFIIDPLQVYEARAIGASAVLLIVRLLDPGLLRELSALAGELGLARLVEVHQLTELDPALGLEPETIGVNCRDLATFVVRPDAAAPVLAAVPPGVVAVAESGIAARDDVERVAAWGADAILVGTALARAADPTVAVRELVGVPRAGRPGMTRRRGGLTP